MELKAFNVGLALSKRKDGLKYSLYIGKVNAEFVLGFGHKKYRVAARKSKPNLFTLKPVADDAKGQGIFTLQVKDTGQLHMEFPVSLTGKAPVGYEGKGCRALMRVFRGGSLQVRRPDAMALLKAYNLKEWEGSGI